jgi:TetR/AcrR family transcriptional regulator, transcriptional repressor for nem operon
MKGVKNPDLTRQVILDAAIRVIHKTGFGATSLTAILKETKLTRGALYHHFPNKKALGLAVVESIRRGLAQWWLVPLEETDDPIEAFKGVLAGVPARLGIEDILLGCPLNNLAQEMSAVDEDFRREIGRVYTTWCDGFTKAFERGKQAGTVAADVSPAATAAFLVASLTGTRGLAKSTSNCAVLGFCSDSLVRYLGSLRPVGWAPPPLSL